MSRIERFENILAWQKARELTRLIYGVTNGPKTQMARTGGMTLRLADSWTPKLLDLFSRM